LLHEIGHKIVAKRHGCWAEFRADPKGLRFGVLLAALLGFLFMAPGAVMVAGVVTRRQNGHIAVAGPLVNLGLFVVGVPLGALLLGLTNAFELSSGAMFVDGGLDWRTMLIDICVFWLQANLILGLFNMLPFGPLDGLKVRDWSESVFYAVLLIFAVPVFGMFFGMWSPMALLQSLSAFI
jgi:Zn-dependent protease